MLSFACGKRFNVEEQEYKQACRSVAQRLERLEPLVERDAFLEHRFGLLHGIELSVAEHGCVVVIVLCDQGLKDLLLSD